MRGWSRTARIRVATLTLRIAALELKAEALICALERFYRSDQPRAPKGTPDGGQWVEEVVHVAAGAPRCQGVGSGGCQNGGSFGSSGMFKIDGKFRCWDCTIKYLGIQGLPRNEQLETIGDFTKREEWGS